MGEVPILRRFRRRLGVRMRSALAAAAVVAVVSVLAGGALLVTARNILIGNVTTAATDRARQVAASLSAADATSLGAALRPSARDRTVVQVLDPTGRVVAASDAIAGVPPISGLRPGPGQREGEERRLPIARDEPFRIGAVGVDTPQGRRTVLVGESLDSVDDATAAIVAGLLIGLPLLAAVVAVATFWFVGRSLRPVEAMRRQAATITSTNLHERLPLPPADDEIAALAATMNTMLERIEAASAAQRRLVADASHELRSPLATIHANADLLEAAPLPDASARSVARIHAESGRMGRLVDDLLLLARVDDHALRLRRADVDLDDLGYAERERIAIEHPALSIEGSIEPVRVSGDHDQLHRAVRNLVDNAVRHARRAVTISVTAADGQGHLVVGNDGPPIAAGDRSKIFDRFVRLDDSRSRQDGGAGLGLPIARDIIQAHGGTISLGRRHDGQCGVGLRRQCRGQAAAAIGAQRFVRPQRKQLADPPFPQENHRLLHKRECPGFIGGIVQQPLDQQRLKMDADISGRSCDGLPQLRSLQWRYLDSFSGADWPQWAGHEVGVEVGAHEEHQRTSLRTAQDHERLQESGSGLGGCLGEDFFERIHHHQHPLYGQVMFGNAVEKSVHSRRRRGPQR